MLARRVRTSLMALFLGAAMLFLVSVRQIPISSQKNAISGAGDVVFHPALLKLLYGGDSFFAANVEMTRVMTSGRLLDAGSIDFFVRLHDGISRLNPCHEDGYYIASAFLPSGGAVKPALDTLERATLCRFWDEWASFMLGMNLRFFAHDANAAADAIREAARRSPTPKLANHFNILAINIRAGQFDDVNGALRYLAQEKERAKDPGLKSALAKRIGRVQGLAVLRKAQSDYESKHKIVLADPQDLLRTGVLKSFPVDPLGIGYEFNNGRFELRQISLGRQGN